MAGRPRKQVPFESLPDRCTPSDLVKFFGFGNKKIYDMLKSGEIPGKQIGRDWIIPKYKFGVQWGFIPEQKSS